MQQRPQEQPRRGPPHHQWRCDRNRQHRCLRPDPAAPSDPTQQAQQLQVQLGRAAAAPQPPARSQARLRAARREWRHSGAHCRFRAASRQASPLLRRPHVRRTPGAQPGRPLLPSRLARAPARPQGRQPEHVRWRCQWCQWRRCSSSCARAARRSWTRCRLRRWPCRRPSQEAALPRAGPTRAQLRVHHRKELQGRPAH